MNYKVQFFLVMVFLFPGYAFAGIGKKIEVVGGWTIYRHVSAMSDKVTCTGVLGADFAVQLNDNEIFLSVPGGPEGYKFRVDNDPPSHFIVKPYLVSASLGFVRIRSKNFNQVLDGKRLRVLVVTYQGDINLDINLSNIKTAEEFILNSNHCE